MNQRMLEEEIWYFAYGSNLSQQQMLRRTGSIPPSKVARLDHYQFAFRRVLQGSDVYATIIPQENSAVYGVVYRCSPLAISRLDQFEGVSENCYQRKSVQVTGLDGEIFTSEVYIGQDFSEESAYPSSSYWASIRTGANEHGLPLEYIKVLSQIAEG